MTFRLGLTGSIGMGKSTTARMFADAGVPVHDSDEAVHRLYAGAAAPLVEREFPGTLANGVVDRAALGRKVIGDKQALKRLEKIIHPLVRADADAFLARHRAAGAPLAVLDIPLLFETGAEADCDATLLATAPASLQRRRVLSRPGMTERHLALILSRQMPDAEKRARATHVVETLSLESTRAYVRALIAHIRAGHGQAAVPATDA